MKVTNKQVVEDSHRLPELRRELRALEREAIRLDKQVDALAERIDKAEAVDVVFDGVAITEGAGYWHKVVDGYERSFHIYLNAHNQKTYGLSLSYDAGGSGRRETWCGAGWATSEEAKIAGLQWLVHGTMPLFDGTGKRTEMR